MPRKTNNNKEQQQKPRQFKTVSAKTPNQKEYIKAILSHDITLCEGPAGSGKTLIAIGMAMELLRKGQVSKILIARPAIEAGEEIGFLPGTQEEKLAPYVRPIMDELSGFASTTEIIEMERMQILEIVPLAFTRGRTFKNAFIIYDEIQNASFQQIIMILTRLGEGSKMVLNGDITQSDLDKKHQGGFQYAFDLFSAKLSSKIACIRLGKEDIVRHSLVSEILEIWPKYLDKYKKEGILME